MSTITRPRAGRTRAPGALRWPLAGLQVFVGVNAVIGGVQLVRSGFGMPLDMLEHTPFTTWAVPGAALLVTVAVPQLAAGALTVADHPRAPLVAAVTGGALVGWIAVQLVVLQRYFFLQPVIALLGAAELSLALALLRRQAVNDHEREAP
jgi:hypothetical protein